MSDGGEHGSSIHGSCNYAILHPLSIFGWGECVSDYTMFVNVTTAVALEVERVLPPQG